MPTQKALIQLAQQSVCIWHGQYRNDAFEQVEMSGRTDLSVVGHSGHWMILAPAGHPGAPANQHCAHPVCQMQRGEPGDPGMEFSLVSLPARASLDPESLA